MGSNIPPTQRMPLHTSCQPFLYRTYVSDNLTAIIFSAAGGKAVQNIRQHFFSNSGRDGKHYHIALRQTFLITGKPVNKAKPYCQSRIDGVSLNSYDLIGKPSLPEIQRHGASYQAQSNNPYPHILTAK